MHPAPIGILERAEIDNKVKNGPATLRHEGAQIADCTAALSAEG
jgi:hypothetical protein